MDILHFSRASSRHSGGKGLLTGSDRLIPDTVLPLYSCDAPAPVLPGSAFRRMSLSGPPGRNGGQHSMVTRPRRLTGMSCASLLSLLPRRS